MADSPDDLAAALATIRGACLPHPDGEFLECFLNKSVHPSRAAAYLLQRCPSGADASALASFLSDWKKLVTIFMRGGALLRPVIERITVDRIAERDGRVCFLTGLGDSFWDPLLVYPIFPDIAGKIDTTIMSDMLCAFLGTQLLDWILSEEGSQRSHDGGYWLVRRSAAAAFAKGYFQVNSERKPEYSVVVNYIGGPSPPSIVTNTPVVRFAQLGQDTPDLAALEILSRFSKPIRWVHVASEIEQKRSKTCRKSILPTFNPAMNLLTNVAVAVWKLIAPSPIRARTYRTLATIAAKFYAPSGSLKVQRLPFGLYLKTTHPQWHLSLKNEYGALALLQQSSDIKVPSPLDLVSDSRRTYLLTSRLPGDRLGHCIDTLSDEELADLVCQSREFVGHLRTIQRDTVAENTISNAVGEACYDFRIAAAGSDDFVGPFANEEEFNNALRRRSLPVQRKRHLIVFTHGDLNLRNILVRDGKLSGVVDWENAGWYPEYWEYTKARYVTKLHRRWLAAVDRVFEHYGDFTEELEIERQLWEYCW